VNKYKVLVHGQNVLVALEGEPQKVGFFTTRIVEANDPEEAELYAFNLIAADDKLRDLTRNSADDPPTFSIEDLQEVGIGFDYPKNIGFSFYVESPLDDE
jgi:hypothetical protein